MVKIHIVTIFPEVVRPYLDSSILLRAQRKKLAKFLVWNPRDFARDKRRTVDDRPYGGGPGMVLAAEPILRAVERAIRGRKARAIILSPRGKIFDTASARRMSKYREIVLIAGHYEGIDARVKRALRAEEISIGDFVLTGGELPAVVVADAVVRHIEGVLGNKASLEERRTASGDVYTRPHELKWKGRSLTVPAILRSGHHRNIDVWRARS